jgi:hypothetical protein
LQRERRQTLAAFPFIIQGHTGAGMKKKFEKFDLARFDEYELKKAIEINDRANIAKFLRRFADNLSAELVNKLADYIDPEITKIYKCGPKSKSRVKSSFVYKHSVISHYKWLCSDLEYTRFFFNQDKEAFFLVENTEPWDAEGNFSPQWKYPHAKRKREETPLPKKGDIEDLICKMYGIGNRTFDDLLSEYNKNK